MNYKNNLASFANEHTISYLLIGRLTNLFKKRYNEILPITFWISREGTLFSQRSMNEKLYKVVAVFPRRPKLIKNDSNSIYFKMNQSLFDQANHLIEEGIPTFAGLPLAKGLHELPFCTCAWFCLNSKGTEQIIDAKFFEKNKSLYSNSRRDFINY